jgi:hypothetical protein
MHIAQSLFSSLFHLWDDHRLPTSMQLLRLYKTRCVQPSHMPVRLGTCRRGLRR